MHGTFYKNTTPNHFSVMATAHKVCTHPRNTSKENLLLRIDCTKFDAVPKTIQKNNLKIASNATSIDIKYV